LAQQQHILAGYLSEEQVAHELGRNVRTLARWRALRIGPPYTQTGRTITYHIDEVRQWLAAGGTAAPKKSRRG
jgi:hypothetical protein